VLFFGVWGGFVWVFVLFGGGFGGVVGGGCWVVGFGFFWGVVCGFWGGGP